MTEDKIEKIGIDKANDEIDFADLVLYVFDKPNIKKLPKYSCPHVHILNKNDLHKMKVQLILMLLKSKILPLKIMKPLFYKHLVFQIPLD